MQPMREKHISVTYKGDRNHPCPQSFSEEQEELILNKNFITFPNFLFRHLKKNKKQTKKINFFSYGEHNSLEFWAFHINKTSQSI